MGEDQGLELEHTGRIIYVIWPGSIFPTWRTWKTAKGTGEKDIWNTLLSLVALDGWMDG